MSTSDIPGTMSRNPDTIPVVPKTSLDMYIPCTLIDIDGATRRVNVAKVNLMTPVEAVAKLKSGHVAWVADGDAESVIAAWLGKDDR